MASRMRRADWLHLTPIQCRVAPGEGALPTYSVQIPIAIKQRCVRSASLQQCLNAVALPTQRYRLDLSSLLLLWRGERPSDCGITALGCGVTPICSGVTFSTCGVTPIYCGVTPFSCGVRPIYCGFTLIKCGVTAD